MNENVKIKINEYDTTSPSGSGVDSTDIAFVPGFSIKADAPRNHPVLVTDVLSFEKLFGAAPRILTQQDVYNNSYGCKAGDYDRSYVYAKELLLQGLPILYSNVVDEQSFGGIEPYLDVKVEDGENEVQAKITVDNTAISVDTTTVKSNYEGDAFRGLSFTLKAAKEVNSNIKLGIELICSNVSTNHSLEYLIGTLESDFTPLKYMNIVSVSAAGGIKIPDGQLNSTQYEFINIDKTELNLTINLEATLDVNMIAGDSLTFGVQSRTESIFEKMNTYLTSEFSIDIATSTTLADKGVYSVKYITTGGYPDLELASAMMTAAEFRGDAVALIDGSLDLTQPSFGTSSYYSSMQSKFEGEASYTSFGAAMYPWALYTCPTVGSAQIAMPASFGYLMCLAKAIKTSPNWLAMAGVSRGVVPNIKKLLVPNNVVSNFIAEQMQPKFGTDGNSVSVNCITDVRPYGLTLWGNRTLKPVSKDGTVALNFLNTRNMLSDVKKVLYTTAKSCMFEQNSDDLWLQFKNGVQPLLNRMKAGNGISDYKIVRGTTKYNGDPLTKGEIAAVVKIYPMYAVEYFELSVEINDENVTIE